MASTWFVRGAAVGTGSGTSWANAVTTIQAVPGLVGYAQGDTVFVADDHTESAGAGGTIAWGTTETAQFTRILCADHTVASPGTGDLKIMTGTMGWTGLTNFQGALYAYGLVLNNSVGGLITFSGARQTWKNCTLSPGTSSALNVGSANFMTWDSCTFALKGTGSSLNINSGIKALFKGGSVTSVGGTAVVSLLNNLGGYAFFDGVDLSAYTGGSLAWTGAGSAASAISVTFRDCKLPSGFVPFDMTNLVIVPECQSVTLIRCDTGATNYRTEKWTTNANQLTETVVVRTGGASDGTTPISWHLATLTLAQWGQPFSALPIAIFNSTVGASVNVTVEGIADPTVFSALPNNDEFWLEVECQGTVASPLGVVTQGTKANILAAGAALTASTQPWDSLANSRVASHAYVTGDIIKVGTNTGRLFICTTSGNSSNDATGTVYSGAVDGGTVNESGAGSGGTAVFKAMWRFKQTVAVTPSLAGMISVTGKMGKPSANLYLDPLITLS